MARDKLIANKIALTEPKSTAANEVQSFSQGPKHAVQKPGHENVQRSTKPVVTAVKQAPSRMSQSTASHLPSILKSHKSKIAIQFSPVSRKPRLVEPREPTPAEPRPNITASAVRPAAKICEKPKLVEPREPTPAEPPANITASAVEPAAKVKNVKKRSCEWRVPPGRASHQRWCAILH